MVHEQANLVFTVPFNLRGDDDNSNVIYYNYSCHNIKVT